MCELCCPPLPVSAIDTAPALLAIVMEPIAVPRAAGANVAFSGAVCPGVSVVLALGPLTLKPAPEIVTLDMVTFAFPAFVRVTPSEAVVPTKILPKSRLLLLELSSGVDASAVPLTEITKGEIKASLIREIDPALVPAVLGAKTMLNVAFCPAATLIGRTSPDVPKPAPVTLAAEIVTPAFPLFCNVIVCELVVPTVTIGKLALVGVAESCPCCAFVGAGPVSVGPPLPADAAEWFDPMTTPAQPLPINEAVSTSATALRFVLITSDQQPDPCRDLCSAMVRQV